MSRLAFAPSRLALLGSSVVAPLLLADPAPALAATFSVTTTGDTVDASPGDGVCADVTGACSLRAAVMEANALAGADSVRMPAGTVTFTLAGASEDYATTGDLDVRDDLTVYGAGPGSTIVDAAGLDRIFHGISDVDLRVDGMTLTGGYATSAATPTYGGAIWMYDYPNAGNLTVTNSEFLGNTVYDTGNAWGGAIAKTSYGSLYLSEVTFSGNAATGSGNDLGGAVKGGYYTTTVMEDCSFTGNQADYGGAISLNGDSEIYDITVADNTATADGGGIQLGYFDHFIVGSAVYGNWAGNTGGGIAVSSANLLFENSTLSGNMAGIRSGGAHVSYGWLGLIHATVAYNRASGFANSGGIWLVDGSTGEATNSILALSNGTTLPDCRGTFTSHGHNIVGVANGAGGNVCGGFTAPGDQVGTYTLPVNPRLLPLAYNGGSTKNHGLRRTSPAIDAGDDSLSLGDDQRGVARPRDGDGDGVAICDVGAHER
ncbi:right-handed parallel beta-helix repeat-containing protein [Myxococcota bacterium]|nr:right-handed parallel beta-helix repeat-containing protein [Myxococcota bacterium]